MRYWFPFVDPYHADGKKPCVPMEWSVQEREQGSVASIKRNNLAACWLASDNIKAAVFETASRPGKYFNDAAQASNQSRFANRPLPPPRVFPVQTDLDEISSIGRAAPRKIKFDSAKPLSSNPSSPTPDGRYWKPARPLIIDACDDDKDTRIHKEREREKSSSSFEGRRINWRVLVFQNAKAVRQVRWKWHLALRTWVLAP